MKGYKQNKHKDKIIRRLFLEGGGVQNKSLKTYKNLFIIIIIIIIYSRKSPWAIGKLHNNKQTTN